MQSMRIALAVLLSLAVAPRVDAQGIGGLIRRKVEDATKAKEPAAKQEDGPTGSKLGFVLTEASLASFQRGLETEIQLRDDYVKKLSTLKTAEQYQACETEMAMSPDGQKIMAEFMTRSEKAKNNDDREKVTVWLNEQFNALKLKRCGEDPKPFRDSQKQQFEKAEEAGAAEFAKGLTSGSDADAAGVLGGPNADAFDGTDAAANLGWYRILKEWIPPFCQLAKDLQQEAITKGVSIAGTGAKIFFVYTAYEASKLIAVCEGTMSLLKKLL